MTNPILSYPIDSRSSVKKHTIPALEETLAPVRKEIFIPTEEDRDYNETFYYGFRYVPRIHNGIEIWEQIPLTLDDVLYPQLDDKVNQSLDHSVCATNLYESLKPFATNNPGMLVLFDVMVNWNIPTIKNPVSDITILINVPNTNVTSKGSYDLAQCGGDPLVTLEVTSLSTRPTDVGTTMSRRNKLRIYQRIGIPYYLVVDDYKKEDDYPPPIFGYRLYQGRYYPMITDYRERLRIPQIGLSLGPYDEEAAWFDTSGKRLLTTTELFYLAETQRERAEEEKARAEEEKARADAAEEELRQLKAKLGLLE